MLLVAIVSLITITFDTYVVWSLGMSAVSLLGWLGQPRYVFPALLIVGLAYDVQTVGMLGVTSAIYIVLAAGIIVLKSQLGSDNSLGVIAVGLVLEIGWQLIQDHHVSISALILQVMTIILCLYVITKLRGGEGVYLKK